MFADNTNIRKYLLVLVDKAGNPHLWRSWGVAELGSGGVAEWRSGGVAEWRSWGVAELGSGGVAELRSCADPPGRIPFA